MNRIISLLLSLLALATAQAQELTPHRGTVSGAYNFWFYKPAADSLHARKPLVVFLHGASLCGNNLDRVRRYGTIDAIEKGRRLDAYVVAPQNPGGSWKPERIMKIVDWASARYDVDTARIYVLGMSLGGYGTIDLAATYPDRIAAALALCGGGTVKDYSGLTELPLWIVHGTADRAVSVRESDKVVAAMKRSGNAERLIYDRVPGMNHSAPARIFYLPQSYEWLFRHSLNDPARPINREYRLTGDVLRTAYAGLRSGTRSYGSRSYATRSRHYKSRSRGHQARTRSSARTAGKTTRASSARRKAGRS